MQLEACQRSPSASPPATTVPGGQPAGRALLTVEDAGGQRAGVTLRRMSVTQEQAATAPSLRRTTAAAAVVLPLLAACGGSSVSRDDVEEAVRAATPDCGTASFTDGETATPGDPVPPDFIECGGDAVDLVGYHFIDADAYDAVRFGIDQPGVLRAFVVEGSNWLVTTDDRDAAKAIGQRLDASPFDRSEYS